jgi:hypothetical protein
MDATKACSFSQNGNLNLYEQAVFHSRYSENLANRAQTDGRPIWLMFSIDCDDSK